VSGIRQTNELDWQTYLTTRFEAKGVSAAPANQPKAKIGIQLLSPAAQALCDGIDLSSQPHDLDEQARRLWQTYSENKISDDEATSLAAHRQQTRALGEKRIHRTTKQAGWTCEAPLRFPSAATLTQSPSIP